MPGLDGFGVVERVGPANMPPVIFVTAYQEHAAAKEATARRAVRGMEAGRRGYAQAVRRAADEPTSDGP